MPNAAPTKTTAKGAMVIGIELPGFAKRAVAEQFKQREQLHQRLAHALKGIAQKDRIVLDTSSGAAVILFGSAPIAMAVATSLCGTRSTEAGSIAVRTSLAMGPIQAIGVDNGGIQMTGDALDVAECVLGLTGSEKLVCTRVYADALRQDAPDCSGALKPLGTLTDPQVREHELFAVQLSHPGVHALRRRRGGQETRALPWLSIPAALTASLAIALTAYLWSSSAKTPSKSPAAIASVAAAPAPTIAIVKTTTPAPSEVEKVAQTGTPFTSPEIQEAAPTVVQGPSKPTQHNKVKKPMVVAHATPPSHGGTPVTEQSIETREVLAETPTQRGKILLAIAPWGEVLIDGKSVGISPPLTEMELTAGSHYVEVRNSAAEPVLRRVELQANETLKIRHRFADSR